MNLVTPKFLTKAHAEEAVHTAFNALFVHGKTVFKPKRMMAHVAIIVPARQRIIAEMSPRDIKDEYEPVLLYEESFGHPDEFPGPFVEIARSKARELWFGQQDGGTEPLPHLLYPGDTPFWGGVKRWGITVAASGEDPWNDRMLAGITADAFVALAYGEWMRSKDKKEGVPFLT